MLAEYESSPASVQSLIPVFLAYYFPQSPKIEVESKKAHQAVNFSVLGVGLANF